MEHGPAISKNRLSAPDKIASTSFLPVNTVRHEASDTGMLIIHGAQLLFNIRTVGSPCNIDQCKQENDKERAEHNSVQFEKTDTAEYRKEDQQRMYLNTVF